MPDAELIDTIHRKFTAVLMDLDERSTRRRAAAEAMAIGRGGITQGNRIFLTGEKYRSE